MMESRLSAVWKMFGRLIAIVGSHVAVRAKTACSDFSVLRTQSEHSEGIHPLHDDCLRLQN